MAGSSKMSLKQDHSCKPKWKKYHNDPLAQFNIEHWVLACGECGKVYGSWNRNNPKYDKVLEVIKQYGSCPYPHCKCLEWIKGWIELRPKPEGIE